MHRRPAIVAGTLGPCPNVPTCSTCTVCANREIDLLSPSAPDARACVDGVTRAAEPPRECQVDGFRDEKPKVRPGPSCTTLNGSDLRRVPIASGQREMLLAIHNETCKSQKRATTNRSACN